MMGGGALNIGLKKQLQLPKLTQRIALTASLQSHIHALSVFLHKYLQYITLCV
jgi:hypothetical protein